jgi:hypothetical protein
MSLLRTSVVFCVCGLLSTAGCGSSKSKSNGTGQKDGGTNAGSGSGGSRSGSGSGGSSSSTTDGGIGPSGPGEEGAPCDAMHKCNGKLNCVASIFQNLGVCARGCTKSTDCTEAGEVCFSYSGAAADGHCVNKVTEEYGTCGVAETSVCDHRSCLYLPDLPIGVCVDTCALSSSASGDDAGAAGAVPDGAVMCAAKESCIDGVLSGPLPNEGICGVVVKRGDSCGIEKGIYCPSGDICAPKDPKDLNSDPQCFQDCSDNNGAPCTSGKCVIVQDQGTDLFAYCM